MFESTLTQISPLLSCDYSLQCSVCNKVYDINKLQTFASCSTCGSNPLIVKYSLPQKPAEIIIDEKENSLWRYRSVLPVKHPGNIISLGEGWTPLLSLQNIARQLHLQKLQMKDELLNPTGSFKARGMSVAVSKAKEYGVKTCIVPTAGNAGGAMSAYCAKAGMHAIVVMPRHTPLAFQQECLVYGAELILVDGLINDCAKKATEIKAGHDFFDMSTMKEPYRLEGKKTMGYEIAEQMKWQLPDVILCPTGGGTGLIGIWKAFREMVEMGWIEEDNLPRMIAVQSENCKPLVDTFNGRQKNSADYVGKPSVAYGLAVPNPFAEKLMLQVLKESGGIAVAIDEEEIVPNIKQLVSSEGIFVAPECALVLAALKKLLHEGKIKHEENILLLNTGAGYKYLESFNLG